MPNTTTQSIKGATLNTVTAALKCGGEVHVLVAGHNAGAAAQAAGQIAGVAKVLHADGAHLAHGLAENMAAQVLALAPSYSHILFPATASGKNVAPRVAASSTSARSPTSPRSISADTFERPIYAGNAIATVQSSDAIKVHHGAHHRLRRRGGQRRQRRGRDAWPRRPTAAKCSFLGSEIAKNDRPELTAAKIIVSRRPRAWAAARSSTRC